MQITKKNGKNAKKANHKIKMQHNAKNAKKMRKNCDLTRAAKTKNNKKRKKRQFTTEPSPRQNLSLSNTCPLATFVP